MKKVITICLLCTLFLFGCGNKELSVEKISKKLNTYNMELEYCEDNLLKGNEILTYTNKTGTTLKYICFHLYPKAFSKGAVNKPISKLNEEKAYPNGFSEGDINIKNVNINGKETTFDYTGDDNNILKIYFNNNLEIYDTAKIEINFTVLIPNINHRFGYGNNAINLANFYPIVAVFENGDFVCDPYNSNGDPFYSECSNYNVNLIVPTKLKVANTGIKNKIENLDNDKTKYYMSAKAVRDFAIVLSDKFETIEKEFDGIKVTYYYYNDDNAEKNLQTGVDALKTFSKLFGKYPYKTMSIVKTNFIHGGMEYPNLVYISDEAEGADYTNVIVHETAHQWWYGVVGSNAFQNAWLDEGLTEYSTALFYEENKNYNIDYNELIKNTNNSYVTFVDLYNEVLGNVDTSMNRRLNEYKTEPEYVYMTYVKGMLFFDNLRTVVGKNRFLNGLKDYFKTNAFKNVSPDNLIASMEKETKRELKSFFNSWIEGKVVIINMK